MAKEICGHVENPDLVGGAWKCRRVGPHRTHWYRWEAREASGTPPAPRAAVDQTAAGSGDSGAVTPDT